MKKFHTLIVRCVILIVMAIAAYTLPSHAATTWYVSPNGTDLANGTSWDTAWQTLHYAAANTADSDLVWVSNGTYSVTSEISITNAITIRGYAGASNTIVNRSGASTNRIFNISYPGAVLDGLTITDGQATGVAPGNYGSGVYMTADATIQNCSIASNSPIDDSFVLGGGVYMTAGTISNCWIAYNGDSLGSNQDHVRYGGGVYMTGGLVVDCVFEDNQAYQSGGGVYLTGGTVNRCEFFGNHGDNRAYDGGGTYCYGAGAVVRNCLMYNNIYRRGAGAYVRVGTMENCTVVGNTATEHSGGVYAADGVTVRNCIIIDNTSTPATVNIDLLKGTYVHCLTEPLASGTGNINGDPQFVDVASRNYRLLPGSDAIDAGTNEAWMATATDLDGNNRVSGSAPDIGAYEYSVGALACSFSADVTAGFDPLDLTFTATVDGTNTTTLTYYWDIDGDGINDIIGAVHSTVITQLVSGTYSPSLTVSNGVGEASSLTKTDYVKVGPATIYVALGSGNTFPYANWTSAAASIQDAVDTGVNGSIVLISNGTYNLTSEVTINDGITVSGKTGDATDVTVSQGGYNNRCFYTTHANAVVENMTLTKHALQGGGVWTSYGGTVRNCIIHGAKHDHVGGGVHMVGGGTIQDCIISNNVSRRYGGAYTANAYNSYPMLIERCVIVGNHGATYDASTTVGGANIQPNATLRNCLVINNLSKGQSGGVYVTGGTVENCTIASNSTYSAVATAVGGMLAVGTCTTRNNIIVDNNNTTLSSGVNWYRTGGTIEYSCTTPDASAYGSGNITGNPTFVDADNYELIIGSPCIDAGNVQAWMTDATDLDGNPRIKGLTVDMGAYEYQPLQGTLIIFQ